MTDEACTACHGLGKKDYFVYSDWWVDEKNDPVPASPPRVYTGRCDACDGTGDRVVQVTNALMKKPAEEEPAPPPLPPRAQQIDQLCDAFRQGLVDSPTFRKAMEELTR